MRIYYLSMKKRAYTYVCHTVVSLGGNNKLNEDGVATHVANIYANTFCGEQPSVIGDDHFELLFMRPASASNIEFCSQCEKAYQAAQG